MCQREAVFTAWVMVLRHVRGASVHFVVGGAGLRGEIGRMRGILVKSMPGVIRVHALPIPWLPGMS